MEKNIVELISNYLDRTITKEDFKELESWISSSDDHKQIFEDVLSTYKKNIILNYSSVDRSKEIVEKRLQIKPKSKRYSLWSRSIAAVFIAGIITVSMLLFVRDNWNKSIVAENKVETSEIKRENQESSYKGIIFTESGKEIKVEKNSADYLPKGVKITEDSLDYSKLLEVKENDETVRALPSTLFANKGEAFKLILSDGTKVWINSETYLEYPSVFKENERRIKMKGEIYLEVAHDPKRPFIVETYNSEIKVLGTKFNVSAYPDAVEVVTTLVEGSVMVNEDNLLKPNEQLSFNKHTSQCSVKIVDVSRFVDWTNGIYHFDSMTLNHLVQLFYRVYGVEIEIKNQKSMKKIFTGAILKSVPCHEMFETIMKTTNIEYVIEKDKITIW